MKMASSDYKYQHIGTVFRLIEQFELISRTDLAKLSGFAPASMTLLTKTLIDHKFILERASQNLPSRGRPAVGLAISPFYWHFLCLTVSANKLTFFLCELNGKVVLQKIYPLTSADYAALEGYVMDCLADFALEFSIDDKQLLAISVSVMGKIDSNKTTILQLGKHALASELVSALQQKYSQPILMNEHFQLWFLAESTLGSLIRHNNVIFLQLDENVNLSVLLKGQLLDEHKRMSIDKMVMPRFSPLSDEIATECGEIERYQLANQITFAALTNLIDRYLPHSFSQTSEKIAWFCDQVEQQHPQALAILNHLTDNLAYMLMNLINIFSTEKIMFNSPLLRIKNTLFEQVQQKLHNHLLLPDLNVDLVTSQYSWDSPYIPATAVKLGIYEGSLIKDIIQL